MSVHKSQLHELAQRLSWPPPHYESAKEGPAHLPRFQVSVKVNGVRYQSSPGFPTVKAAEQDAARVALAHQQPVVSHAQRVHKRPALSEAISSSFAAQHVQQPVQHQSGLCKNAVQEFAQKSEMPLPVYKTVKTGEDHDPTFTTTVDVGGTLYSGRPAKSKKEAEIKAAVAAIQALKIDLLLPSPEMQGRIIKRARTRDPRNIMRQTGVMARERGGGVEEGRFEAMRGLMSSGGFGGAHKRVKPESFYTNPWPECLWRRHADGEERCPMRNVMIKSMRDEEERCPMGNVMNLTRDEEEVVVVSD